MREILMDIRHASRVLTSAPVTSAVAVLAGSYVWSRRALRQDPAQLLRSESQ